MNRIFLILLLGVFSCVVEDSAKRVTAATEVSFMRIHKDTLFSLNENQVLYFGSNYDGIKFKKDGLTLIGYVNTKGQETMDTITVIPTGQYKKFSIKKRFGNYFITKKMVDELRLEMQRRGSSDPTHFILEPVASEHENYISYEIRPEVNGGVQASSTSTFLLKLDPSPPAAAISL